MTRNGATGATARATRGKRDGEPSQTERQSVSDFVHTPVLLAETLAALRPTSGQRYVDATVGGGGHGELVLMHSGPTGMLLGIDADPAAMAAARRRLERFGDRVTLVNSYFDRLAAIATDTGFSRCAGVLFDLGVSSAQLDQAERGFSFQHEAELDMRLGPGAPETAGEIVNSRSAAELQRIFQDYGEERYARRIADRIVHERSIQPITTTTKLAAIVSSARPGRRRERIHPATRVFQALRIAVNDELGRLERALPQAVDVLQGGGRLAVISFHSLEDRIVKTFMRTEAKGCVCPPAAAACVCGRAPRLRILTNKPITASETETAANPRARSAKLRIAERLITEQHTRGSLE